MQSFSPVMLARIDGAPPQAAPDFSVLMEAMRAGRVEVPWWVLLGNFVLGVLSIWVVSKWFAGEKGTIGRALLLILGWVGMGIVLGFIMALGIGVVVAKAGTGGGAILVFGCLFLLLFLVSIVAVPSMVYEINTLKSIGFVVVNLILSFSLQAAFEFLVLGSTLNSRLEGLRTGIALARRSPEDIEALRAQLRQRKSELQRRYEQLEIHRLHLPPGDARERQAYEREKADYEADLERLRAEAALLPPAR